MKILNDIDISNNQAKNMIVDTRSSDPEENNTEGKIIYNSTDKKMKYFDGDKYQSIKCMSDMSLPYCEFEITDSVVTTKNEDIIKYVFGNYSNCNTWMKSFETINNRRFYKNISPFLIIIKLPKITNVTYGSTTYDNTPYNYYLAYPYKIHDRDITSDPNNPKSYAINYKIINGVNEIILSISLEYKNDFRVPNANGMQLFYKIGSTSDFTQYTTT